MNQTCSKLHGECKLCVCVCVCGRECTDHHRSAEITDISLFWLFYVTRMNKKLNIAVNLSYNNLI